MSHPATMRVKPAPGIKLLDPAAGDYLPGEGRTVPRTGYWIRRVKDGDAVRIDEAPVKSAAKDGKGGK